MPSSLKGHGGHSTTPVDLHVGTRIRERRVLLGLTQEELAKVLGITYQQMHKYERAINRVPIGRLCEIAKLLRVKIGYFLEGLEGGEPPTQETEHSRQVLKHMEVFTALDYGHRQAVAGLARDLKRQEEARMGETGSLLDTATVAAVFRGNKKAQA